MLIVENFEKLLTDFFALHHPRQVKKVSAIASEFKGKEIEVLKALCTKYKKSHNAIPGLVEAIEEQAKAKNVVIEEKIEEPELLEEDNEEDITDEQEIDNSDVDEDFDEEDEEDKK